MGHAAEEQPTSPTEAAAAPQQLQEWIKQLDDDRFDTRQTAQQKLEDAGQAALELVAEAAKNGSLESSTRAINILLQWSETDQQELRLASLERLAKLPNRPRESAMANQLLAEAREQRALEALSELGARYTGDSPLQGMGSLQIVFGPDWKGGDEGLKHLADLPHTATISFHSAPLEDSALEKIAVLPNLTRVELYGTPMSPEAVKKFKQQAPNVVVEEGAGAVLGVRGDFQGTVQLVEANSAADKAGIRRNDRITEFNGEKLADFSMLRERIAKHQAGDSATLTIERNNQTRQVKVTFGDWSEIDVTKNTQRIQLPRQGPQILPPKIEIERR